jgi:hypothetical protein
MTSTERSPDDLCREWTGALSGPKHHQYGTRSINGKMVKVHRYEWEQHYGPIPEGMKVLHRCDNPKCYRLDHLFLGTQADNVRDMLDKRRGRWNADDEACHRGHPRTPENTYISPQGERKCRVCGRENARKRRAK